MSQPPAQRARSAAAAIAEVVLAFALVHVAFRAFQKLGTPFGAGLIVSSLLFGLIHVLNPYDWFSGRGNFAWWAGLATAVTPFGLLRERTGGVVCPIAAHFLANIIPRLIT
jgi:membrane protease YdiL (CAAX protease family)